MHAERRERVLVHGGAAAQGGGGCRRSGAQAGAGDAASAPCRQVAHQRIARRARRPGSRAPSRAWSRAWRRRPYSSTGRAHRPCRTRSAPRLALRYGRCGQAVAPAPRGGPEPSAGADREARAAARIGRCESRRLPAPRAGRVAEWSASRVRIVEIRQRRRRARSARRGASNGQGLARFLAAILDPRTQGDRPCPGLGDRMDDA